MKRTILIILCSVLVCLNAFAQDAKSKNNKETTTFFIEKMNCNNCIKTIEKNIAFEKGVTDLKCDLSTHTAQVTYRKDKTTEANLISAFKKIGMPAVPVDDEKK